MFCVGCNAPLEATSRFCARCGRPTADAPTPPFRNVGLSGLDGVILLEGLRRELSQTELMQLDMQVREERKDAGTMMVLACIGFIGVAGINRFAMGEIGTGILWLLTWGLCGIGTIFDLVTLNGKVKRYNYDLEVRLTNEFLVRKRVREGRL